MKRVFIMGAFFDTAQEEVDAYKVLANYFYEYHKNIVVTQPSDILEYKEQYKINTNCSTEESTNAMVDYDLKLIRDSNLLFANLTNKSLGVGIELGVAIENKKNIVFVAKKGSKISDMVFGGFHKHNVFYYEKLEDLKSFISNLKI